MKHLDIMLIDDNEIDTYVNEFIIAKRNIAKRISKASSAKQGLRNLAERLSQGEHFPELIFLDIKMPEMDGFGFLAEFLTFPPEAIKNCNVVMLTSSHNLEDKQRAANISYVKKYLEKPLNDNQLDEVLKHTGFYADV